MINEYIEREQVLTELENATSWTDLGIRIDSIPATDVVELPETGIGDLSDGYHTFNGLYEQRMILFSALVKAYKDRAWKSYRHEDGEYCFGGGWFIVGIDTPEGTYTYHYENKFWDMFDCPDLPRAKHWDGHTEADAETRLMSLPDVVERKTGENINAPAWIPVTETLPEELEEVNIAWMNTAPTPYYDFIKGKTFTGSAVYYKGQWFWYSAVCSDYLSEYGFSPNDSMDDAIKVTHWMPLPEPPREEK